MRWSLAIALILWAFGAKAEDESDYRASVSVVVDASSAMRPAAEKALFEQTLATVRDALDKHVPRREGLEASLRLMGGSGVGPGDACEASEMVVPPGVSAGPVLKALGPKVNPKGPRPLATALEGAANDLSRTPGTMRQVVLVTSGADGCSRDVCQVARELRSEPGLGQVRVLLVGGGDANDARLRCLGPVTSVRDQAALATAMQRALEAAYSPAELKVTALDKGLEVPADVELYAADDDAPLVRMRSGDEARLAGGHYQIRVALTAKDGTVREGWRRNVELAAGSQVSLKVALGSQPASVVVRVRLNGRDAPDDTRISVHRPGETENALFEGIPGHPLRVSPGRYDVRAEIPGLLGPIEVWRPDVRLEAGVARELTLDAVQRQGSLRVDVFSGKELLDESIVTLVPNGSRTFGQAGLPLGEDVAVPAGIYTVLAHLTTPGGSLDGARDDVKVAPDQASYIRMDLGPSGQLTVEIVGHTDDEPFLVSVLRAGEAAPVGTIMAWEQVRLPAGKYDLHVEDRTGKGARTVVQRGVVVAPGGNAIVRVKL